MNKHTLGWAVAVLALSGCTTDNKNSALSVTSVSLATATTTTASSGATSTSCAFAVGNPETAFPLFAANGLNSLGAAGFVVRNQLVDPTTVNTAFNTDSTTFSPHQAVIDYEIIGGTQTIAEQIVPVSATPVDSGALATVVVPVFLPTAALAVLKTLPGGGAVVRTTVRIEGKLDDGSTVSTSEHEFVVSVSTSAAAVGSNSPCF
jgi:hypothetical protein